MLLFLYTDGVVDAQNPQQEPFGSGRLLEAVQANQGRTAQEMQDDLLSRLQRFIGDAPQFDDITLMAVARDP
jgi:sigma-B regulation protein RsbU (phosphoserine phosphatase)